MNARFLAIGLSWAMGWPQLASIAWTAKGSAEESSQVVEPSVTSSPIPPVSGSAPKKSAALPASTSPSLSEVGVHENTVTFRTTAPVKYNIFWLTAPRRLVVDLLNTELAWPKKMLTVNGPLIQRVRSGQFQKQPVKIARVVLDLNQLAEYTAETKDGQIVIALQGKTASLPVGSSESSAGVPSVAAVIPSTPSLAARAAPPAAPTATPTVTGVAPVTGTTSPSPDLPAVQVSTPLVVTSSPAVAAAPSPSPAPAPATSTTAVEKEVQPQPAEAKKGVTLPTSPVTLDFVDADVRDVLHVLAAKSGINIVFGSDVTGAVTVHLDNVPFDQAFQTILILRGLVAHPAGDNILRVISSAALTAERAQAVTFTKVFPLRYAKATDIKAQLDAIRGAEGRKGTITSDPATGSLVITDTPEGLQQAERHIRELDRAPSQVAIEAKILEVTLGKRLDLGIDWGYARTAQKSGNTITVGGTEGITGTAGPGARAPSAADRTNRIALPAGLGSGTTLLQGAGASGTLGSIMSFGVIGSSARLDAVLRALVRKGQTKILSNPRVITLNNQEAKILVGDRIPYTIQTQAATTVTQGTQFVEVGVKLTVTPTINVDKRITLKIRPEVSQASDVPAGQPPRVSTREAETVIMIRNGETIVIGGLISEQTNKTATQIPLLGDIPVLGQLFKTSSDRRDRTELLVFVTPTIVED